MGLSSGATLEVSAVAMAMLAGGPAGGCGLGAGAGAAAGRPGGGQWFFGGGGGRQLAGAASLGRPGYMKTYLAGCAAAQALYCEQAQGR